MTTTNHTSAMPQENFHVVESSYRTFLRTLRLPYSVDTDKMKADFDNGVLTVTLPICREKEKARKIPVECGAGAASLPDQKAVAKTPSLDAAQNADPKSKAK